MQKRPAESNYDKVLKILSLLEYSKPVALATISRRTEIKLGEVISFAKMLEEEKIIERGTDNGNTFYTLVMRDYHARVEAIFNPPPPAETPSKVSLDSREAIRRRRSLRNAASGENTSASASLSTNSESAVRASRPSAEPISAVDLLAMKRSSGLNPRVYESGISNSRIPRIPSSSQMNPMTDRRSSSFKSVYVSRPISRPMSSSRSMYTPAPPAGFDPTALERSDTNFKTQHNNAPVSLQPLIPSNAVAQVSNEVSAAELFEKLDITEDTPLLTVLGSRPSFDVWSSCSALVNAGGGILILGMRQYGHGADASFFIKSLARPEESMTNIYKAFNDRDIISDCPKDMSFMSIVEFGRKKVLVMRLQPSLFARAPLYLTRDSFGMRTNQGCYIYRNGKAERCSQEETQKLWESIRLGLEVPDWEQKGEILPVQMSRTVKVNLPPVLDDAVRPMSRKVSTYGQPLPQNDYRIAHPGHTFHPSLPEIEPPAPAAVPEPRYATANTQIQEQKAATERDFKELVQDGLLDVPVKRLKPNLASAQDRDTLQLLLFAEDIRMSKKEPKKKEPKNQQDIALASDFTTAAAPAEKSAKTITATQKSAEPPVTDNLPPRLSDDNRALLESIASPATEHLRLPTTRLVEIAASLLSTARLTPLELSDLLKRKLPVVRTKILASFSQNPNFKLVDNTYYIEK